MKRLALTLAILACLSCALPASALDVPCWPVVYYKQDPVSHETETSFGGFVYVRHRTPAYAATQLLSFHQEYPQEYPRQFYFAWPLSGVRTGNGHDAWLFPILWSGSSADRTERRFALFPAVYYGRQGNAHTLNIALLQHNTWDATSHAHYLFPLFWYDAERNGSHTAAGLLPLLWFSRSSSTNDWRDTRSEHTSSYRGALLLSWWGRSRDHEFQRTGIVLDTTSVRAGVFPFFMHNRHVTATTGGQATDSRENESSLWIFPYWQSKDVEVNSNRVTGAVTPFRAEREHVVFPVYWAWDETHQGNQHIGRTLLPLWWRSAEYINGELHASSAFVVPIGAHFFRQGEYDTINVAGPLFTRLRNDRLNFTRYDALFPLLSRTAGPHVSGGRVFPLFGWENVSGRHANSWFLFPFGWRQESAGEPYEHPAQKALALHELEQTPWVNRTCRESPERCMAVLPFWWSRRTADEQSTGFLPFYWRDTHRYRETRTETILPLLLGAHETESRDGTVVKARQDYLFSLVAHGSGKDSRLWRAFPFFSYEANGGYKDVSSLVLPFSYSRWTDPDAPSARHGSELSVPFSFLPIYGSRTHANVAHSQQSESWLFPFYSRSADCAPKHDVRRLSILWPFWNAEWENDETRIRGLGGVSNFYERDSNGFVEQRFLYRLFTRRNRSWFHEHEFMPFFSRTVREDGSGSWDFLGGLLGAGRDTSNRYVRLLYIPITTGKAQAPAPEEVRASQERHATYALSYLKHNRYDRAAIEFTLAGDARANDAEFQLATAEAYLNAQPADIAEELRSSIPPDLKSFAGASRSGEWNHLRRTLRESAVAHFETAMRLGADKPSTLVRIAKAQCDLNENEKALATLEQSDTLRPAFSTAMERVAVLPHIANNLTKSDDRKRQTALLEALLSRYPESPTLLLTLSRLPAPGETNDLRYVMGWNSNGGCATFSSQEDRELALLRRGAVSSPGTEEQAWLATAPKWLLGGWNLADPLPRSTCARQAIGLLNGRIGNLLTNKKAAPAEALLPEIRALLPRACAACDQGAGGRDPSVGRWDSVASGAASSLYRVYVTEHREPLTFIATAKEWAAGLCVHQRKEFEEALKSVRFEQQYLKDWRITGTIDGKSIDRTHHGDFFQRYVDLDALLEKPDHCEVVAECTVVSPDERPAVLRLGFDHQLTAELNGKIVFGPKARKIAVRDEYAVPVTLTKGANRLRLTVADDTLGYGFFARLSAPTGELMEDVTLSPAP